MRKIAFTLFGATGDLAHRKLLPALYNLFIRGELENDFDICAIGRRDYSDDDYQTSIVDWIRQFARLKTDDEKLQQFFSHVHYLKMEFTHAKDFAVLDAYYQDKQFENHLVYLAVAPLFFDRITEGVYASQSISHPKIIIEKPFGDSLENAKMLSEKLEERFGEEQIYRIDHYLGKEMIRNILAIRESNPIFARVWDSESIESVHISALEEVGVETRGAYYDKTGAMMDMVSNHLFQLMTLVGIDDTNASLVDEQIKVLEALRPVEVLELSNAVILGQYKGYQDIKGVASDSQTETYVALKLFIDNERWRDVPFFIRTGKKTSKREVEVVITFKKTRLDYDADVLTIKIQPTEGVILSFNIKTPGDTMGLEKAEMEFCQSCADIYRQNTPEAYERMILACLGNDRSWFSKWQQIEASWRYILQLKARFAELNLPVYPYEQGSLGPVEVESLAGNEDQRWKD